MSAPVEHIVSVSGGKDSTALYLLAMERGRPFRAVFADTGNEHEWTYDFVRELPGKTGGPEIQWVKHDFSHEFARRRKHIVTKWPAEGISPDAIEAALRVMRPSGNPFLDLCLLKGRFPSSQVRFCTEELKIRPMFEQVQKPILMAQRSIVSWQGVRAQESRARALLPKWQRIDATPYKYPMKPAELAQMGRARAYAYRPLINWSVEDVWEMHRRHGIVRNALYDNGMSRVGCMPCIMARKGEIRAIADIFPEHVERIAEWEAMVSAASHRGAMNGFAETFFPVNADPTFETGDKPTIADGIRRRVEWSRTSDGKQLDMMLMADFNTACNTWGACE